VAVEAFHPAVAYLVVVDLVAAYLQAFPAEALASFLVVAFQDPCLLDHLVVPLPLEGVEETARTLKAV
jgi:hypothetical protein